MMTKGDAPPRKRGHGRRGSEGVEANAGEVDAIFAVVGGGKEAAKHVEGVSAGEGALLSGAFHEFEEERVVG
jgi:hypothetical protein